MRCPVGSGVDGGLPADAAVVPGGVHFFSEERRATRLRSLRSQLTLAGYAHVAQVVAPGEYSVRGGLVHLFPMGSALPFRLDLFDDEIENIKTFDIDTQRTLYPVQEIRLLPAREFPARRQGSHPLPPALPRDLRRRPWHDPESTRMYRAASHPPGSNTGCRYSSMARQHCSTTCPATRCSACTMTFLKRSAGFWRDTQSRHAMLSGERSRPLLPPGDLFLSEEAFFVAARPHARVILAAGTNGPAALCHESAIARPRRRSAQCPESLHYRLSWPRAATG